MNNDERYVAKKIYKNLKTDERVTETLDHCLYCTVNSSDDSTSIESTGYKIPLDCISGAAIKQCPACKRIYILKDPTE